MTRRLPLLLLPLLGIAGTALGDGAPAGNLGLVARDGTLGTAPAGIVAPGVDAAGRAAEYLIRDDLGQRAGGNLFHSFERFGIGSGETATFTGPAGIDNVISRVTGGISSQIDGTLRSTVPGAAVYLVNPSGVVFGANSHLDVPASFHVSTAQELRMADGTIFSAVAPEAGVLTTAPPRAFGFLGAPAPIVSHGDLSTPEAGNVSLIGGEILLDGGFGIATGNARVSLIGVASPGEVAVPGPVGSAAPDVEAFGELADVTVRGTRVSSAGKFESGDIYLRGRNVLLLDGAILEGDTVHGDGTGRVDIQAREAIRAHDGTIRTRELDDGTPIPIHLEAASIELTGSGKFEADLIDEAIGTMSNVTLRARDRVLIASPDGVRSDGDLIIEVPRGDLVVEGGFIAHIGGNVRIDAARVTASNGRSIGAESTRARSGQGGDVTVNASEYVLVSGSGSRNGPTRIWTLGNDSGSKTPDRPAAAIGDVFINTPLLRLEGTGAIATESRELASGGGGDIFVVVDRLEIGSEGQIYTTTRSLQPAGDIHVTARESIDVRGTDRTGLIYGDRATGIQSRSESVPGPVGNVYVSTPDLVLREGGSIGTISLVDAPGGDVHVDASRIHISGGSILDASTTLFGAAGDVYARATESIVVRGTDQAGRPSRIGSLSFSYGKAGDVRIETPFLLVDGGVVSTSALALGRLPLIFGSLVIRPIGLIVQQLKAQPKYQAVRDFSRFADAAGNFRDGGGGDLTVEAGRVLLQNGAKLDITNWGSGASGTLLVRADALEARGAGTIVASRAAGGGSPGSVSLDAREIRLDGGAGISLEGGPAPFDGRSVLATVESPINSALRDLEQGVGFAVDLPEIDANFLNELFANRPPANAAQGGNLAISTERLLMDGASISAGAVASNGGNIDVVSRGGVSLRNGARIDASVQTGSGGNVGISAADSIEIQGGSSVRTTAGSGTGGNLTLATPGLLRLRDGTLTTSVASGDGGNLTLLPSVLLLQGASHIFAQAGVGRGGQIRIVADAILKSRDSVISASAGVGVAGTVDVQAPDANFSPEHAVLDTPYVDPGLLLTAQCATRRGGSGGSFRTKLSPAPSSFRDPGEMLAVEWQRPGAAPGDVASGAAGDALFVAHHGASCGQ